MLTIFWLYHRINLIFESTLTAEFTSLENLLNYYRINTYTSWNATMASMSSIRPCDQGYCGHLRCCVKCTSDLQRSAYCRWMFEMCSCIYAGSKRPHGQLQTVSTLQRSTRRCRSTYSWPIVTAFRHFNKYQILLETHITSFHVLKLWTLL